MSHPKLCLNLCHREIKRIKRIQIISVFYILTFRGPDREANPRPLAYGNTASIEGTTTLRRFNDQGLSCGVVRQGISRWVLRGAT
jgi:hypothetical protein